MMLSLERRREEVEKEQGRRTESPRITSRLDSLMLTLRAAGDKEPENSENLQN